MKIQILGSAAAPTWPDLWNKDEYCENIRKWGGKNIRSRSQAIIDDEHLIDYPIDSYYHSLKFNINFANVRDIFVTHSHEDHFWPYELAYAMDGNFAYKVKYNPITIYGNEKVGEIAEPYIINSMKMNVIHPYDTVTTEDGYKWTALPANHKFDEEALNYIIEHDGKTVLYKVDSGAYKDEKLLDFLKNYKFDCIITECTFNFNEPKYPDHEVYSSVLNWRNDFINWGMITDKTPFWLTHIHYFKDGLNHDEAQEICDKDNIKIAFDGAVIEI